MASEVVKVQLPIFGGIEGFGMVYDRNRNHMIEQPISANTRKALKGDMKGYFNGTWSNSAGWVIGSRVPDQDW